MPFIEAPTTFYLGKRYDQTTNKLLDEVVYYDSRDLTTHAVVVGMTGSGKTGMCISLLEEAVLDNIPALIIDPKGDITNLLLTFPELRPQDFAPWVNESDAQRARMDVGEFAADVAKTWKDGLASWGIGSGRIAALKNAAQFSIYTPGSDAGLPVSILASLQAPRDGWEGNDEFHREQISGLVRALLGLVGKNVNPVKDKEHVLISNIFEHAWRNGRDLTLEDIIMQVQNPPFDRLGVFDVNTFFKEKDRFKLAQELNNIIASPSFQTWITGEPLDMRRLLYTAEGKARVSIFYLAHLNDAERAFIITLLTENVLAWMRTLSGTTSLRSIVYFDEVFGHIPPAPRNPPTKDPLLRLLKQGRAFGIGLILATQNPGDLDYKSLSNAGSWFIGKLQTENDKKRVLSGLEAVSTAGNTLNLQEMDKLLSNLSPRVFLLHNVHNGEGSLLVQSRWAMSYLRGPLTRQQIRTLMADQRRMLGLDTAQITPPQDGYQYQPSGSVGQSAALPPQQPLSGTPFFAAAANPSPSISGGGSRVGTLAPSDVPPPPAELPEDNAHSAPAVGGGGSVPPTNAAPTGNFLDRLAAESKPSAAPKKNFLDRLNEEAPASLPPTAPPTVPPTTPAPTGNTGATPFWLEPTNTPTPRPAGEIGSATQPMGAVSMPPNMPPPANTPPSPAASEATLPNGFFNSPPVLPSSIAQYFLPVTISVQEAVRRTGNMGRYEGSILLYQPVLLAQMGIRYLDKKSGAEAEQFWAFHIPNVQASGLVRWNDYQAPAVAVDQLAYSAVGEAAYGSLGGGLTDPKRMTTLRAEALDYVARTAQLKLLYNSTLDMYSMTTENRVSFANRVAQKAREARDAEIDTTAAKYDKLLAVLEIKLQKKAAELNADKRVLDELKREDLFTTGEAVMSLMRGRTSYTLSRMSRARRYKTQAQVGMDTTERTLSLIEDEIEATQNQLAEALKGINDKWTKIAGQLEEYAVRPFKKDIAIEAFGIGWIPAWYVGISGQGIILAAFGQ